MDRDADIMVAWRLRSQWLAAPPSAVPEEVVGRLGGVQAQDRRRAPWSVGVRCPDCTEADVAGALRDGRIVRTWLFRGTLHWVTAADYPWLTALLAPRIIGRNARRYRQLGLDDGAFDRSQQVLRQAIGEDGPLTRDEIKTRWIEAGVPAEGQQVPYLLQRAALDGVICFGPDEPTYVLVSEWIGATADSADPETDLRRLAERYIVGHGPATAADFAWWSGFTLIQARAALRSATGLGSLERGGETYWAAGDPPRDGPAAGAHLLPPFDDYLLGYRDRSRVLDPRYAKRINRGGGMFKPAVLVNGRVAGIWSGRIEGEEAEVSVELFREPDTGERELLEEAGARWGDFHGSAWRPDVSVTVAA